MPPSANPSKAKDPASRTPTSLLQPVKQWQAHETMVTSVEAANYRGKLSLLVTAGIDSYVHLWAVDGAHIGTFGQVTLLFLCVCVFQSKAKVKHSRACDQFYSIFLFFCYQHSW